jgi:hypothetical protein
MSVVVEEISLLNRNLADTSLLLDSVKAEVLAVRQEIDDEKAQQDKTIQEFEAVNQSLKEKKEHKLHLSSIVHGELVEHSQRLDFAESELQNKVHVLRSAYLEQHKNFDIINRSINAQIEEVRQDQRRLLHAETEGKAFELAAAQAREAQGQRRLRLEVRFKKEEAFLRYELQEKDKKLTDLSAKVQRMEDRALSLQQQQQHQKQQQQPAKKQRTTAVHTANQHHRPGHNVGRVTTTPGAASTSANARCGRSVVGQQYSFEGFRTGNGAQFYD